jgi:hypothetical protein
MRVLALAVVSLMAFATHGFVVPRPATSWTSAATAALRMSSTDANRLDNSDQWDAILSEGSSSSSSTSSTMRHKARAGPKQVVLPQSSGAHHNTLMASSIAVDPMADLEAELMGESSSSSQETNEDYFEEGDEGNTMASNTERVTQYIASKEQPRKGLQMPNMQTFLEGKDMTDITIFLIFPSIVGASLLKWAYGKAAIYTTEKTADLLQAYATEMCYHDGDLEEMKLAHKDYSRVKLAYLGPLKKDRMLKSFLTVYAKKKNVSPQSIRYLIHLSSCCFIH